LAFLASVKASLATCLAIVVEAVDPHVRDPWSGSPQFKQSVSHVKSKRGCFGPESPWQWVVGARLPPKYRHGSADLPAIPPYRFCDVL